jgi:hypothetical protein
MMKKVLVGLLVIFIAIQLIRPERNNGQADTSQDIAHYAQVPDNVMHVLKTSCYDCHSNHTDYPWYTNINPVGLWMNHHVEEGKGELNFSEFATYNKKRIDHKLEEIAEEVEEGHMPLPSYLLIHTDAKLSKEQMKLIVDWAKSERQRLALVK